MGLPSALHQSAGVGDDVVTDLEALVRIEAQHLLDRCDLVGTECGPVHAAGIHLGRGGIADDGAQRDERRPVGDLPGRLQGRLDQVAFSPPSTTCTCQPYAS